VEARPRGASVLPIRVISREKLEYIRQNPGAAGLVSRAEDYRWLWWKSIAQKQLDGRGRGARATQSIFSIRVISLPGLHNQVFAFYLQLQVMISIR
jgi:hypothetical protein